MQSGERVSIYLKICLPFLILVLFNVWPVSRAVTKDLREAEAARSGAYAETAVQAYRRALVREPWRAALWDQIGQAELAGGHVSEAVDALLRAEQAGALSVEGRFQLGEAYLRLGQIQAAVSAWETSLRLDGPSARVYERLFQTHRAQANFPAAIAVLRSWRAFAPADAQVAFLLGLHLSVFETDAATPLLVEASQKDARYTAPVQVMRRGLGQAGAAENEAYRWLMIGRALGSISQWDLAGQAFQRAVTTAPEYGDAWALLGEARYHIDGSGAAEMERANRFAPDSPVVRALTALYWRRTGKPEVALQYLRAIAKEEPKEPRWQVDIALTLVQANDFKAATEAFQKAIDLAPTNPLYWQYLALFSAEYNYDIRSLGLPAARKARQLAPDDAGALDTMGLTMLRLGDTASAERFLQQALEKDATHAPASLHMGWLYLQQQDMGRAYLYLKQAASLSGENPIGVNARRLLQQYYGEGS